MEMLMQTAARPKVVQSEVVLMAMQSKTVLQPKTAMMTATQTAMLTKAVPRAMVAAVVLVWGPAHDLEKDSTNPSASYRASHRQASMMRQA